VRITVLASGSQGNATLVEAGRTRILVDAGLSRRALRERMREARDVALEDLSAIVITHGHGDHAAHAVAAGKTFGAPIHVTQAAKRASFFRNERGLIVYGPSTPFIVGDVTLRPLPVPHDAPQVALVLEHADRRAAIVTDLGHPPAELSTHLAGCDTVLLESNYDERMLESGPYPERLKKRVAGRYGHLSNNQAADVLRELDPTTECVVLMHLSQKNNRPELAQSMARDALGTRRTRLLVARQDAPLVTEREAPRTQPGLPL